MTLISTVKNYILATISHKVSPEDEDDSDLKLFLDFDLEVLGRQRAEYDVYRKQIRREYAQFDDQQFSGGRSAVLQKILNRERVYFSDAFFERLEERARENLRWELGILRAAC